MLWIAALLLCFAALWLLERALRARTQKKFPPTGTMVEAGGRLMHVCIYGAGRRTIVFLPGLGTASPDTDFLPLTRRLTDYRCVVPEPLGYGFSQDAVTPRTADNIIDELREGLSRAGVQPPYFLLGHSISGLYMRRWACRYPDEIAGLIGDDPSLPEQMDAPELTAHLPDHGILLALCKLGGALNRLFGLGRLWTRLFPAEAYYMTGGDMSLLPLTRALAAEKWNSRAFVSEYEQIRANARCAGEAFPACPYLMFTANGKASCGGMTFPSGFSWVQAHEETAARAPLHRFVTLPSGHYIHWMFPDRMAVEIASFFPAEKDQ